MKLLIILALTVLAPLVGLGLGATRGVVKTNWAFA